MVIVDPANAGLVHVLEINSIDTQNVQLQGTITFPAEQSGSFNETDADFAWTQGGMYGNSFSTLNDNSLSTSYSGVIDSFTWQITDFKFDGFYIPSNNISLLINTPNPSFPNLPPTRSTCVGDCITNDVTVIDPLRYSVTHQIPKVPEPASSALLILSLAGLGWRRRKQREQFTLN